jgi:multiple sugar transport system substrate-binding protein
MRRLAIVLALIVLSLPVFASAAQEQATGPVKLLFWTHEDKNRAAIEDRYVTEFQAANAGVTIEKITHGSTKIQEAILTAFAANQGPDIFNMSIEDEYPYIANGRVAPVAPQAVGMGSTQAIIDSYIPNVLDPVTVNGKLYGLPLELTNWSVFVNKNIFRSAGLDPDKDYPRTWEDMVTVSEKIVTRNGDIITRRGFDFRYPYYLVEMMPLVEQLGGKVVSDDGKTPIVGDAAWIKFLDYMRAWGPHGKNLGSPTYKPARSLFNFDKNEIAMASTGLYQEGRLKADNAAFFGSPNWAVGPFPVFKDAVKNVAACYYGHYYMVNGQTPARSQTVAWKFIGFMLSHPEEYLEKVSLPQPTKKLMASKLYTEMPFSKVFTDDMARAHIVYYGANSAKLQSLIEKAVQSAMLNNVASDKALATLKKDAADLWAGK